MCLRRSGSVRFERLSSAKKRVFCGHEEVRSRRGGEQMSRTRRRHLWPGPRQLVGSVQKKLGGRSQALPRAAPWWVMRLGVHVERCRSKFESDSRGSEAVDTWGRFPFHLQTSWYDTCRSRYARISLNRESECQILEKESPRRGGKLNTRCPSWSTQRK